RRRSFGTHTITFPREPPYAFYIERQREDHDGRRPGRHAAALGTQRRHESQGDKVRLRYRPVWRVHCARARAGAASLSDTSIGGGRCSHYDHRRALARWFASPAAGMAGARRAAVWVLSGGSDHVGRGTVVDDAASHGCADQHCDERQLVPLRNLYAPSRSHSPCGVTWHVALNLDGAGRRRRVTEEP